MKPLASLAFGAIALATSIGFAEPAAARGNVGVYIGPGGIGISVDQYRDRCRDGWYSRHHWDRCSRYGNNYGYYDNGYYGNGYDNGYYGNGYNNGYYGNGYRYNNDWNERNRHHHHDRYDRDDRRDHRDRDDRRGGGW